MILTMAACTGGGDEGPYFGPYPESLWNPCRHDVDELRDGTIETSTYNVLDDRGRIVESYTFFEGQLFEESHATYDGRRLRQLDRIRDAGQYLVRSTYEWDRDLVVDGSTLYPDGQVNTNHWEYDETGRVIQTRHVGPSPSYWTQNDFQHLDNDACPDVWTMTQWAGNPWVVRFTNRPDCQFIRREWDVGIDGVLDNTAHVDYDAGGHPLVIHIERVVGGVTEPTGEWRYAWSGDLCLTAELVNIVPNSLFEEVRWLETYDCPEGVPPH